MNLTEELRKLAVLHEEGHLTDAEFADAKRRLIAESGAAPSAQAPVATQVIAPAAEAPAGFAETKFRSSRWSSGNVFFPDSLTLASDGLLFRKGALFGSSEEHVHYSAVASFKITNGIFLSSVSIETSGGSQPIFVNGLWKKDAKQIQDTIRVFQRRG
ncbi:MAG: SHOCT domain-containing protein [Undibacterium sp.]|nr:SHOCT domain-containing protein [Opitutaceae bacterium]